MSQSPEKDISAADFSPRWTKGRQDICLLLLCLALAVPVLLIRQWTVGKRPVVMATASGQHDKQVAKGSIVIVATLEFDRPDKSGHSVHCKVDDQWVGNHREPGAYDRLIYLAVRTDSCYDAVRVDRYYAEKAMHLTLH